MTRILSLFVMFMLCGVVAFSQNRVVTGTVTDEKGAPVEGATVKVVGANTATSTDQLGNFRLANVAPNASLVITSVAINSRTITTGTSSVVPISVTSKGNELTTVTVGALGIRQNPRTLGTARGTVSAAQLTNGRPVNVAQALSGKISSLSIVNTSASVNASPRIIIRGLRSITGNNQALVVLDGVAVPSNVINQLNPNDIERIDVVKGGQAATLFGTDGINGALVITTKKGGGLRRPEISFTNNINVEALAYLPRTQHGFGSGSAYGADPGENFNPAENQQYGDAYDGSIRPLGRTLSDGSVQLLPYSDIRNVRSRVWDRGYTRQSDLAYRSGDANSSFFASIQNLNSNGIVPGDRYERTVLRLNAGRSYNKIGFTFDASYTFDNAPRTNTDYYFLALNSPSWAPFDQYRDWKNNKFANPNGYYNDYYNNPYWELDNNRFNTRTYGFNGNIKMDYRPTAGLTLTGRVNLSQTNTTQTVTANTLPYTGFAKTSAFLQYHNIIYDVFFGRGRSVARTVVPGAIGESQGTGSRITFDAFGVYDRKFGQITSKLIFGAQAVVRRSKTLGGSTAAILLQDFYNLGQNSFAGIYSASNSEATSRGIAGFADLNLGWRDMIYVQGSYRKDYKSVLSAPILGYNDPSFSTYGGSISFIPTELISSLKDGDNKFVESIRLRASINHNGNENPIGEGALFQTFPNATGFPYSGLAGQSVGNTLIANDIVPEELTSYEAGIDIGLFDNRLVLEGSLYRQNSERNLLTSSISAASGFPAYFLNAANLRNEGYEVDVKAIAYRSKDLQVNLSANYSYNTNEVIKLFGTTGLQRLEYQAPDDRASLNAQLGQTFPYLRTTGYKRDANGQVIVNANDGWPERTDGRVDVGTTLPKHQLGVGFNVKFKNISLIANAEFRGGAVVYHDLGTDMAFTGSGAITALYNRQTFIWPNSVYLDASGKSIPNTNIAVDQYKAIYQGFGDQGFSRGLAGVGENFVSSADFWKIRDIALNYEFPESIFGRGIFRGAMFSVWGRNIATWLPKDNWYTDPEFSNTTGNSTGISTSLNTPPTRQLGATLKLSF